MVTCFPVSLLLGTVLGFLSGIGTGGGSLLLLWLTVVTGIPPETARCINLLFFIPSAIIASLFRWKQGSLNPKIVLPAIFSGCISAALFSWISQNLNTILLKKLFGVLLILTGIREFIYNKDTGAQTQ